MGERLLCKQEVIGSNPFTSTTAATALRPCGRCCASNAESGGVWRRLETPCGATRAGVLFEG